MSGLNDSATFISDDDILSLWRTVRPSANQDRAMVYQTGPEDGDHPTFELRQLIELAIEYGHNTQTCGTPQNARQTKGGEA